MAVRWRPLSERRAWAWKGHGTTVVRPTPTSSAYLLRSRYRAGSAAIRLSAPERREAVAELTEEG
jgi:hypothetical protein